MPRQIILASRPSGWPPADNFALTEADRPDLADGQVRVRNLFMSVDPYMRGRMNDVESYVPPFRLGEPLEGGAIGTVTESRSPGLAIGDLVLHMLGWRDEAVLPARSARKVTAAGALSPSAYLGVLAPAGLVQHRGADRHGVVVGGQHLTHRAAVHRGVQPERRQVGLGVVHPAAHVGVHRHEQVTHPDLPVGQVGPVRLGQREVVVGWPAGGPGGEDDLAWHGLLPVPGKPERGDNRGMP